MMRDAETFTPTIEKENIPQPYGARPFTPIDRYSNTYFKTVKPQYIKQRNIPERESPKIRKRLTYNTSGQGDTTEQPVFPVLSLHFSPLAKPSEEEQKQYTEAIPPSISTPTMEPDALRPNSPINPEDLKIYR
jgi:hypothetical protein